MNKTEKTNACRKILYGYNLGETVNNNDRAFLLRIFKDHAEWLHKKGSGVKSVSIIQASFNTRCFQINRTDGTCTDISFVKCITKPSKLADVKQACRTAIRKMILEFRKGIVYGSLCPITGEILTRENSHVDHYDMTFDEVFKLWIKDRDINKLEVNETKDGCFETKFKDDKLSADFLSFHNKHCKLRVVTAHANLSIL